MAYQAITAKVTQGGNLITRGSSSEVGIANYTLKRDWRRDLDRERRREGHDHFWGNQAKALGRQPFPNYPDFGEPIVLVHLARQINGKNAIIVGTETKLWRFFSMDDWRYVLGDENGIYVEGDENGPYFQEEPGDWILIGSGYKTWEEGAHRWEAVEVNGETFFNNGADLIQRYNLKWMEVQPCYELREQGIARVGTIASYSDILMLADITEIKEDAIPGNFALADSGTTTAVQLGSDYSGLTVASQGAGSFTVTCSGGSFVFDAGMVGLTLRYSNGFRVVITAFVNPTEVTVDTAPVNAISGRPFWIVDAAADYIVTSSAPIFAADMVGRRMLWDTGEVRRIVQFIDASTVEVDKDYSIAAGEFGLENLTAYGYYEGGNIERRQGRTMWSILREGHRFGASVPCQIDQESNILTLDYPVQSFSRGDEISIVDRNFEAARVSRDGTIVTVMTREDHGYAEGNSVKISGCEQPEYNGIFKIFDVEDRAFKFSITGEPLSPATSATGIILIGAGIMTAKIIAVRQLGKVFVLDTFATEPFNNAEVVRSDVSGSILGYEDLQDDGAGILRMLELQGALVFYKDTGIVLASFTGVADSPFSFQERKIPTDTTLHFRWTLVSVQGQWHLFAGRNGFYRFDLTNQNPQELQVFDWISNVFFDVADIANTNEIFSADNAITKEILIVFNQDGDDYTVDRLIAYDYKKGTTSTSSMLISAGGTVKRPESGISPGETEDWFIMGGRSGEVLIYGKVDRTNPQWSAKEIFYRRHGEDTETKDGYASVLRSGLSDFGDAFNEKDVASYVPLLASQSTTAVELFVELFGAVNASATVNLLTSKLLDNPQEQNLVAVFYRSNYFQVQLTISGMDNPAELNGAVWQVDGVKSASVTRRTF